MWMIPQLFTLSRPTQMLRTYKSRVIQHFSGQVIMTWLLNPTKTKEILIDFSKRRKPPHPLQSKVKLLGVSITHDLKWNMQVDKITAKANQRVFWLSRLKGAGVPPDDLIMIYKSVVRPVLEYASVVWHPGLTN